MTSALELKDFNMKEMGIEFSTLDDLNLSESVTMLAYGAAGTGKTWFVGTAGPRTLIINIGNGLATIKSPVFRKKFYSAGLPIIATIHEERDEKTGIFKVATGFDAVCDAIDVALAQFPDRFDTIAVDDATQLRGFAANKALEVGAEDNRSKTLEKAKKYGTVLMAQQDFFGEMNLVEQFVAGTVDLARKHNKHFILTAHERYVWKKMMDQKGKVIGEEVDRVRPAFTGKSFPDDITGHFDLVWHFEAIAAGGGQVYRAHTAEARKYLAKTRYPEVFKGVEINPNFLKIVAAIKAAK